MPCLDQKYQCLHRAVLGRAEVLSEALEPRVSLHCPPWSRTPLPLRPLSALGGHRSLEPLSVLLL